MPERARRGTFLSATTSYAPYGPVSEVLPTPGVSSRQGLLLPQTATIRATHMRPIAYVIRTGYNSRIPVGP